MGKQSSEDAIRTRAYHLWEDDGRPAGRADEYWEKARALLESTPVTSPAEPAQGADAPPKSARAKKAAVEDGAKAAPAEKPAATKRAAPKPAAGDVSTAVPAKKSGKKADGDAVTTTAAKAKPAAKTASGETAKPARKTATAAGAKKTKAG